jgi:hypothetical protein
MQLQENERRYDFMRDIDQVILKIRNVSPTTKVRQVAVSHPGVDDNGIWFFEHPSRKFEVQLESSTGMCPFLIETSENDRRINTTSVEETVAALMKLLHMS